VYVKPSGPGIIPTFAELSAAPPLRVLDLITLTSFRVPTINPPVYGTTPSVPGLSAAPPKGFRLNTLTPLWVSTFKTLRSRDIAVNPLVVGMGDKPSGQW